MKSLLSIILVLFLAGSATATESYFDISSWGTVTLNVNGQPCTDLTGYNLYACSSSTSTSCTNYRKVASIPATYSEIASVITRTVTGVIPLGVTLTRCYVITAVTGSITESARSIQDCQTNSNRPVTNLIMTVDKNSPQKVGTVITVKAVATGSPDPIQYLFRVRYPDRNWRVMQGWSGSNVVAWNTIGLSHGNYIIQSQARRVWATSAYEKAASITYSLGRH